MHQTVECLCARAISATVSLSDNVCAADRPAPRSDIAKARRLLKPWDTALYALTMAYSISKLNVYKDLSIALSKCVVAALAVLVILAALAYVLVLSIQYLLRQFSHVCKAVVGGRRWLLDFCKLVDRSAASCCATSTTRAGPRSTASVPDLRKAWRWSRQLRSTCRHGQAAPRGQHFAQQRAGGIWPCPHITLIYRSKSAGRLPA
jgi:hypothetical protein